MRPFSLRRLSSKLSVGLLASIASVGWGQEGLQPGSEFDGSYQVQTGELFRERLQFQEGELVNYQVDSNQPTEGIGSLQPTEGILSNQPTEGMSAIGSVPSATDRSSLDDFERSIGISGAGSTAPSSSLKTGAQSETAGALQESKEIQTVNIQRRSSISFDPRVRGYHLGQLITSGEGVYWMPVRPDLDSMLSKIDPQLVDNINVYSGPYAARFGPGFSFIDVNLADTPRFDDCPQSFNRIGYDLRTNGSRQYFHDTLWGGSSDYGYIVNYGFRNGSDYLSGNRTLIPGSYNVNNVSAQLGFQLSQYTKLETRYDFLDQTKTQYPGQFFRVDRLQTNNISFSLNDYDDPYADVRVRVDGWFNRTPMRGSVDDGGVFRIRDRVETALENLVFNTTAPPFTTAATFNGTTTGAIATSGGRLEALMGEPDQGQLRVGTDLRFIKQNIGESFVSNFNPPIPQAFGPPVGSLPVNTQLPQSEMLNPGIYSEAILPMTENWTARLGGRIDFVHASANGALLPGSNFLNRGDLQESNTLYAFYLMNDVTINDCWTANIGFGQAQRPPTLLERYADGVFVSVLQSGFTRVIGEPDLNQERLWQADATLAVDYGYARMSVSGFQSWILDYITYQGGPADPTGALLVRYASTPLATLTGFEFRADADLNSCFNTYVMAHYVQGQDQTLAAPLPGMPPFDSRFGLLWHSVNEDGEDEWGVDTNVRVVASQDRLGRIRREGQPLNVLQTIETFTPSFTTVNLRGYWNPTSRISVVGGVENLLNENYLEHLDLRLPAQTGSNIGPAFAYAQGITPYLGFNYTY